MGVMAQSGRKGRKHRAASWAGCPCGAGLHRLRAGRVVERFGRDDAPSAISAGGRGHQKVGGDYRTGTGHLAAMHWLTTAALIVGLVLAFLTGRKLRKGDG